MSRKKELLSTITRGVNAAKGPTDYRRVRHWRLDFINENTLMRVWSMRMTRWRVALAAAVLVAAIAALIMAILLLTPLGRVLPGRLSRDARSSYVELALRLDSLERHAAASTQYAANVAAILNGEALDDPRQPHAATPAVLPADSLMTASEAERMFVNKYDEEATFNLSVLAPIAAQGMTFATPVSLGHEGISQSGVGLSVPVSGITPVAAMYRGTVISRNVDQWGNVTLTVQHPNDFVSVYGGLTEAFVSKGDKVTTGQRIGHAGQKGGLSGGSMPHPLYLELWHNGSPLDIPDYIPF